MKIIFSLILVSLLSACQTPNSVRIDGLGEVRYDDRDHRHSGGKFCPPGQAMKNRC